MYATLKNILLSLKKLNYINSFILRASSGIGILINYKLWKQTSNFILIWWKYKSYVHILLENKYVSAVFGV